MKLLTYWLLSISCLALPNTIWSQCNGSIDLCSKPYNEVAFLTTHNAYNADDQGFNFPNQNFGITQQLNDGVRGLMLDVYDLWGTPSVYHGTSLLGSEPLSSNLNEIKVFLDNNPTEIVTIILECYVDANTIESELNNSGLSSYLYNKPIGQPWSTLQEMITNDTRLVIFTDVDDASPSQSWYHYVWDYAVETHYSVNSSNSFTNDYNRGTPTNDLFIFNHFVTNAAIGTGNPSEAAIVNEYNFLMDRIQGHFNEYAKFPNFITLDFHDLGQGKRVVDSLNSSGFVLNIQEAFFSEISISPNPSDGIITVKGLPSSDSILFEVFTLNGKLKRSFHTKGEALVQIDLKGLHKNQYILRITDSSNTGYSHRIQLN